MNEYYRTGRGDKYVEVSTNWEENPDYELLTWWFKDILCNGSNDEEVKKALLEVADSIQVK